MKSRYKIDQFQPILDSLVLDERNFRLIETNYTKDIRIGDNRLFFSDQDFCPLEMKLLNLVRSEVDNYEGKFKEVISENDIDFYSGYELMNGECYDVWKVDVDGAYWECAKKNHIIAEKSIAYYEFHKDEFSNGAKKARLKALGSLATQKRDQEYIKGKRHGVAKIKVNQVWRNCYLHVCEEVDMMMRDICVNWYGQAYYYYWDCVFIDQSVDPEEVKDFIYNRYGYGSKFDASTVYVNGGGEVNGRLIDLKKLENGEHADYPIRMDSILDIELV